ncbi:Protein DEK [Collichthys lucidus]|uniref:Protein DEK n=1 Tax=Collichthys lucidus TaxID=240159 RepID=A0A4U5V5Y5_COLLU|nr:Protein DEK [Collichthys lucidus]
MVRNKGSEASSALIAALFERLRLSSTDPDPDPVSHRGAGEIIEGKRAKKSVERLDFQAPKQKEKLKIGDGSGDKLGDIPRTGYQISKMKPADLKPLYTILFDRPGKMATLKKNLRLFNGFPFDADSQQYTKKREKLLKNSNFTNTKLKVVCSVLDLEKKGTHSDLVDRILTFLIAPKNSGKVSEALTLDLILAEPAENKSKPKPSSSSSSPKKSKTGSKSKAIVMDSSSDEDDDEEDEKAGASAEAEGSETEDKPSEKDEDRSDKSDESVDEEEEDEEEEEEESPKSKSSRGKSKKSAAVKRQRTPAKKTGPPKKRVRKEVSDESDADSEADEKPKKKKSALIKPAAKTKKADSSSNSKNTNTGELTLTNTNTGELTLTNTNTAEDTSDDDEPLIRMVKKAPSDEQLKETVQSLLKEANLEEMTMKQICQRVFDTYPEHDLTSKKDYIKQTVKSTFSLLIMLTH